MEDIKKYIRSGNIKEVERLISGLTAPYMPEAIKVLAESGHEELTIKLLDRIGSTRNYREHDLALKILKISIRLNLNKLFDAILKKYKGNQTIYNNATHDAAIYNRKDMFIKLIKRNKFDSLPTEDAYAYIYSNEDLFEKYHSKYCYSLIRLALQRNYTEKIEYLLNSCRLSVMDLRFFLSTSIRRNNYFAYNLLKDKADLSLNDVLNNIPENTVLKRYVIAKITGDVRTEEEMEQIIERGLFRYKVKPIHEQYLEKTEFQDLIRKHPVLGQPDIAYRIGSFLNVPVYMWSPEGTYVRQNNKWILLEQVLRDLPEENFKEFVECLMKFI